ncbi:MAG: TIGR03790 family protein [Gammaproteobacteria bacterium]|nr:MAG: TIGR03790 family protein [Gammaproteobacteria bacterium]
MQISRLMTVFLLLGFASNVTARITAQQIAIVINTRDADSALIADYYQNKRGIPQENLIRVSMPAGNNSISEKKFNEVYQQIKKQTPDTVQYYALAWSKPFKVACMSMTSAVTFGFDKAYCAKGCKQTRMSSYYNSDTELPNDDLNIRPAMMLAGSSVEQVYAMIDRGAASDGTKPEATAYLMNTSDKARNVRSRRYKIIKELLAENINIEQVNGDVLKNKNDVMFYFTGRVKVKAIDSNKYLPGAIADHLTSTGGKLFGSKQMSILRWLEAGATASYGTVVEPCAFTQKFPNPGIVIERYTNGESLIEAYWKSVAWPGQGVFVGEPMASPYARK